MRRFNLSAWAVAHPALILFLIVMFGVAGLLSYRNLGRAEDPSFTIKVVVVTAMWPGATAAEMQAQVADPIEKKLQELPYFDKVTTYTKPAFTAMQVAFKDNTPARDVPELFYQLRKKVSDIKDNLPAGLIGPSVNDEYGDVDSILYMLTARGRGLRPDEEGGRGAPPASAEGQGRHQGQPVRHAGRKDLRRVFPRQTRDAWHHDGSDIPIACQAERGGAVRHRRIRRPSAYPCASQALSTARRRLPKHQCKPMAVCFASAT